MGFILTNLQPVSCESVHHISMAKTVTTPSESVKVEKVMLESGSVRHSYGKDCHLLENDDIFHYGDAVNTATEIRLSRKKHLNNTVITFTKDIHGQILSATEVRGKHGGWLSLVTCYRLHKKDKARRCPMPHGKCPQG